MDWFGFFKYYFLNLLLCSFGSSEQFDICGSIGNPIFLLNLSRLFDSLLGLSYERTLLSGAIPKGERNELLLALRVSVLFDLCILLIGGEDSRSLLIPVPWERGGKKWQISATSDLLCSFKHNNDQSSE